MSPTKIGRTVLLYNGSDMRARGGNNLNAAAAAAAAAVATTIRPSVRGTSGVGGVSSGGHFAHAKTAHTAARRDNGGVSLREHNRGAKSDALVRATSQRPPRFGAGTELNRIIYYAYRHVGIIIISCCDAAIMIITLRFRFSKSKSREKRSHANGYRRMQPRRVHNVTTRAARVTYLGRAKRTISFPSFIFVYFRPGRQRVRIV